MSDCFEIKVYGDKINQVKFIDSSLGAERFVTGTYDSEVSLAQIKLLLCNWINKSFNFVLCFILDQ